MKIIAALAAAAAVVGLAPASPVAASTLFEVVTARANARAGGPTNQFDADTLERYGALSGTRNFRGTSKRFRSNKKRHNRKGYRSYKRRY